MKRLAISNILIVLLSSIPLTVACSGSKSSSQDSDARSTVAPVSPAPAPAPADNNAAANATAATPVPAAAPGPIASTPSATANAAGSVASSTVPTSGSATTYTPGPALTTAAASVADIVTVINSLPMPVTMPAFFRALPRPLALTATSSTTSLQPAYDANNPRMFVISGNLVLAVVPMGKLSNQLEIGMRSGENSNTFASINFPVTAPLSAAMPYLGVMKSDASGTNCTGSFCHVNEAKVGVVGTATLFTLNGIVPVPTKNVSFATLTQLNEACSDSTARCQLFNAIFAGGAPTEYTWPANEFFGTATDFFTNLPTIIPAALSGSTPAD